MGHWARYVSDQFVLIFLRFLKHPGLILILVGILKQKLALHLPQAFGWSSKEENHAMSRFRFLSLVPANIDTFGVLKRSKCCFWLIFVGFYSVWWKLDFEVLEGHRTCWFWWFSGVWFLFVLLSFFMISVFWGGLNEWEFDSRWAFKCKVGSQDQARSRCHFGGSPRTKIMKFHEFNFHVFCSQYSYFHDFGQIKILIVIDFALVL